MAITPDNFKWADSDLTDPITGQPNKVEPDVSQKASGLLREEALVRPHINYQFNQYHKAFIDIQSQIDALVLDAGTAVLQKVFPIGSIYTSASSITAPSDAGKLGFGTWVRLKGKFLVGIDEADTAFDGVGETGGAKTHTHGDTLSVDGHVLSIAEMPAHTHTVGFTTGENDGGSSGQDVRNSQSPNEFTATSSTTGSNQAHTHGLSGGVSSASSLPPYYAVYMWRRTA